MLFIFVLSLLRSNRAVSLPPEIENDFVHSNGLNAKDEKRGSIKKSSSSQLNVTSIANSEKDEHMNSIIRYQTLQPLHYNSNNKNSGRWSGQTNIPDSRRF